MIAVADALARLLALAEPLAIEEVLPASAARRALARDLSARRTQPAADLSAMDGYAIRYGELPGPWTVVGESVAGAGLETALAPGQAARIFTGAPLPADADTILVQEEAARDGAALALAGDGPPRRGAHVRPAGSDFREGVRLLRAGTMLGAPQIALAVAGGHGTLPVRRRARVALLSTGNELVPPGVPTTGVMLPSSNAPMLAALLAGWPVELTDLGIVPDDRAALATACAEGAAQADVLVTLGGASVGDHDLVRPALDDAGAVLDFWRIAMRPGKPLLAGRLGTTVVVGLPGNPVSAFVTATLFLLPLIATLTGDAHLRPRPLTAPLGSGLPANGPRAAYLRGRWSDGRAIALEGQDSAGLTALAAAELLIVRAPHAPATIAGETAEILVIA